MSSLEAQTILSALERKDIRTAKRSIAKLILKKPKSLFTLVASVYVEYLKQDLDDDQFEVELMKACQKSTEYDNYGMSLLRLIIIECYNQRSLPCYDLSIRLWNLLLEKNPKSHDIMQQLFYLNISSLNLDGALQVSEKMSQSYFLKYSCWELSLLICKFHITLYANPSDPSIVQYINKIKQLAKINIEKKYKEAIISMSLGEVKFLCTICLEFDMREYVDCLVSFIKKIDTHGIDYRSFRFKQLKYELTYKNPKDVLQQTLLCVYKWYHDIKCYKIVNNIIKNHCQDEDTFLDLKKKLDILILTLTKKYPLTKENRALYLFRLQYYDTIIYHKYFKSLTIDEQNAAYENLENSFVHYINYMKHIQPIVCECDLVDYLRKNPSFKKHLLLQSQPTDNEKKTIALLNYRAGIDDTMSEYIFSNSGVCADAFIALVHLKITSSKNPNEGLVYSLMSASNYLHKYRQSTSDVQEYSSSKLDRRCLLVVAAALIYAGDVTSGINILKCCNINHHLLHTICYAIFKILIQYGEEVHICFYQEKMSNELSHMEAEMDITTKSAFESNNFTEFTDMMFTLKKLFKCHTYHLLTIEKAFLLSIKLDDLADLDNIFETCYPNDLKMLFDNRDFGLYSEFRKFDITNQIIDETFKEDLIWITYRRALCTFMYGMFRLKHSGYNDDFIRYMKTGADELAQLDTLILYPAEYYEHMFLALGSRKQAEILEETKCFQLLKQSIFECEKELICETNRDFDNSLSADCIANNIIELGNKYSNSFVENNSIIALNELYVLCIVVHHMLSYCCLLYEYVTDSTSPEESSTSLKIKDILAQLSSVYSSLLKKMLDDIAIVSSKDPHYIMPPSSSEFIPVEYSNAIKNILTLHKEKVEYDINHFSNVYSKISHKEW